MLRNLFISAACLLFAVGVEAQSVANFHVVPQPVITNESATGEVFDLGSAECIYTIDDEAMLRNAQFLAAYVAEGANVNLKVSTVKPGKRAAAVRLLISSDVVGDEAYRITVNKWGITIEGSTPRGVFYGVQTLRKALLQTGEPTLLVPCCTVAAAPRFAYRGMHLDVSRHFFDEAFVMRYLDMMALHGMNTLHWHLSDDQGWRVEIKKWPRLTTVGSVRNRTVIGRNMGIYDDQPHGGYFTQEQVRRIVAYAAERHITIIPEIDMPGHMLAALAAYPELGCTGGPYEVCPEWGVFDDILCGGNPRVYEFLCDVVDELSELFPGTYFHLGGDEAPKTRWEKCPRCQQKIASEHLVAAPPLTAENQLQGYMVRFMAQHLAQKGRRLIGWDEIMDCNVDSTATVMSWRDFAKAPNGSDMGNDVIMAPNSTLYFDHYQLPESRWSKALLFGGYSPLKKVYNYDPAPASMPAAQRRHVIGVQANLWTEYIAYPALAEYQVLPRMAALSEVQWMDADSKDYEDFLHRLPCLLNIYRQQGWRYCNVDCKPASNAEVKN